MGQGSDRKSAEEEEDTSEERERSNKGEPLSRREKTDKQEVPRSVTPRQLFFYEAGRFVSLLSQSERLLVTDGAQTHGQEAGSGFRVLSSERFCSLTANRLTG